MRDVTVERTVPADPSTVATRLTPSAIIANEGQYLPFHVFESEDWVLVTVEATGRFLTPQFVFERLDDGFVYRRYTPGTPVVGVETRLRIAAAGPDATTVRFQSTIRPPVPIPPVEWYLAWRRRRTLERVCDRLEASLR